MMDHKKPLLQLLALLLFLSCLLLPLGAVPLSRSLALGNKEPQLPEVTDQAMVREVRMMEEEIARMDIESNDYPGSGANNRHDPRSPGRA
ncbi:uncharacterized protein LOC103709093 isoform X1 [Phoenix dactylifera]|uniref:Uncharacterized protein LOC103709093 isoform X1 n=1 Tax=Phoenix dactylifera TaxID=42345 RepID=A0A8B7C620_PHODC|nr:uncharacterized protein LOC103709093 isoform X1 [Phoenix dactylifera]